MKILIAYDGSDSADTAIDGLQRAGFPSDAPVCDRSTEGRGAD